MKNTLGAKTIRALISSLLVFSICLGAFSNLSGLLVSAESPLNAVSATDELTEPSVWNGKKDTYNSLQAVQAAMGKDSEGCYLIDNAEQLYAVINFNGGGAKYKLTRDIILNTDHEDYADWDSLAPANDWDIVCNGKDDGFYGSFNGLGHTVYGLYIAGGGEYRGLFPSATNTDTATIINLNVNGASIKSSTGGSGVITGGHTWSSAILDRAHITVSGCRVQNAEIYELQNNVPAAAIIAKISRFATIEYCAVENISFTSIAAETDKNGFGAIGTFFGGIYVNKSEAPFDFVSNQSKYVHISNCYSVNATTTYLGETSPSAIAGVYNLDNGTGWAYSFTVNDVYTDAFVNGEPVLSYGKQGDYTPTLKLSIDGKNEILPQSENYPVKQIDADDIIGDAAREAMPTLLWDKAFKPQENATPTPIEFYNGGVSVWNGDKSFNFDEIFAGQIAAGVTGAADNPYLIETAEEFFTAIASMGGKIISGASSSDKSTWGSSGKHFKLTNDIVLNRDYLNFELWSTSNAPLNSFNYIGGPVSNAILYKGFDGNIDGNGHTIFGFYGNVNNYDRAALIPESSKAIEINGLTMSHFFSSGRGGASAFIGMGGGIFTDCSVQNGKILSAMTDNGKVHSAGAFVGDASFASSTDGCSVIGVDLCVSNAASVYSSVGSYQLGAFFGRSMIDFCENGVFDAEKAAHLTIKNSFMVDVLDVSAAQNGTGSAEPLSFIGVNDSFGLYSASAIIKSSYSDNTVTQRNVKGKTAKLCYGTDKDYSFPNYDITEYQITADSIIGEAAKAAMPELDWDTTWDTTEGYPVAKAPIGFWSGNTDVFDSLEAVLETMSVDSSGRYHIENADQLYGIISFNGGGNSYVLDRDLYLNRDTAQYKNWINEAPENNWCFGTQSNNSASSKQFIGDIDGLGHTIYGLYCNSGSGSNYWNGLLSGLGGAVNISNLTVANSCLPNATRYSGIIAGGFWYNIEDNNETNFANYYNCRVENAIIAGIANNGAAGAIQGLCSRKTVAQNCAVINVKMYSVAEADALNSSGGMGSFFGGGYASLGNGETDGFNKNQAQKMQILDSFAINTVNGSTGAELSVAGAYCQNDTTNMAYCLMAENVYTTAFTEANDFKTVNKAGSSRKTISLLVGNASGEISPDEPNFPIKHISSDEALGISARENMPELDWDTFWGITSGYPVKKTIEYWDGSTATVASAGMQGDGSRANPFLVTNGTQLYAAASSTAGYYFSLQNDIYLNEGYLDYESWTATSDKNRWVNPGTSFKGNFDGNGYTVYGLFLPGYSSYSGLFSINRGDSEIRDLSLKYFYNRCSHNSGGIVAHCASGTLNITNCHVSNGMFAAMWGNYQAGGIIGTSADNTVILGCSARDVKFVNNMDTNQESTKGVLSMGFGALAGSAHNGAVDPSSTTFSTNQAAALKIYNSYGINCTVKYTFDGKQWQTSWTKLGPCGIKAVNGNYIFSITAAGVYTDAEALAYNDSNLKPYGTIKLTASLDGTTEGVSEDAIRFLESDAIITGEQAKTAMSELGWGAVWQTTNGYPVYAKGVWDGSDNYTSLYDVISTLSGNGNEASPYIIENPAELHAVIKYMGGGYYYRLANNMIINEGSNIFYTKWGTTAPKNQWGLSGSNQVFNGTIDGNGHTIYGYYNSGSDYVGLIPASGTAASKTGENITIKNLDMTYSFSKGNNNHGLLLGCRYWNVKTTVDIEGCILRHAVMTGFWDGSGVGSFIGTACTGDTVKITGCAAENIDFTPLGNGTGGSNIGWASYGSILGNTYTSTSSNGKFNLNQARTAIIDNCYTIDVINTKAVGESAKLYPCGIKREGNGGYSYCVTIKSSLTDATVLPKTLDGSISLIVTDGTISAEKNTVKIYNNENIRTLFDNHGHWYMAAREGAIPIPKHRSENFRNLDITCDLIDDSWNARDVSSVKKKLLDMKSYRGIDNDINRDGQSDIRDLIYLKREIAGIQTDSWNLPWNYSIVYPSGDKNSFYLATLLQEFYKEKANLVLKLIPDTAPKSEKEILVGNTNRGTSSLSEQGYAVRLDDIKLIFEGGHPTMLEKAVKTYIANGKILEGFALSGSDSGFAASVKVNEASGLTASSGEVYKLTWSDEFDGNKLDNVKFNSSGGGYGASNNVALFNGVEVKTFIEHTFNDNDEYAHVKNGELVFHSETVNLGKDDSGTDVTLTHTARAINTSGRMWFRYGYAELRAKIPLYANAWPAWWCTARSGADTPLFKPLNEWEYFSEVDMFEFWGNSGNACSNLHKWYKHDPITEDRYPLVSDFPISLKPSGSTWTKDDKYYTHTERMYTSTTTGQYAGDNVKFNVQGSGYHTFGFLWTPEKMVMSVDGQVYGNYDLTDYDLIDCFNNNWGFQQGALHMILDNWINAPGDHGGTKAYPKTGVRDFIIDYMRIYQSDKPYYTDVDHNGINEGYKSQLFNLGLDYATTKMQ